MKRATGSSLFGPALQALEQSGRAWSDPISFQDYCRHHGISEPKTAARISVQSLETLDELLVRSGVMVFRLGRSAGSNSTRFALVRAPNHLSEFFFIDRELFRGPVHRFPSSVDPDLLIPFRVLEGAVEASAVSLAIASGLLAAALEMEPPAPRIAPVSWASTRTFEVRPHEQYEVRWSHHEGQVEIDALLFGRVGGRPTLFVVEAKHGPPASLSKHKLAYAIAVVSQSRAAQGMSIAPVYLRSEGTRSGLRYRIARCALIHAGASPPAVASLQVERTVEYELSTADEPST